MRRRAASVILMLLTCAVRAAPPPAFVDHRPWQTPIRSQHGQNCFIYATVAALEARLNREGYGALDLSEGFSDYMGALFFLETCAMDGRFRTRTPRVPGAAERETSLAVDYQPTVESATPCQIVAIPEEKYFPWDAARHVPPGPPQSTDPYWREQWEVSAYNLDPLRLPRSALTAPLYYGIQSVRWLTAAEAAQPEALERALAAGDDVIWDFKFGGDTLVNPWRFTVPPDPMGAGHRLLLVGYDRRNPRQPYFIAKNSWGPTTNAGGFTHIGYDFIRYGIWAHTITALARPRPWPELRALGRWTLRFGDQDGLLDLYHLPGLMRRVFDENAYTNEAGQRLADRRLGTFYPNGDRQRPIRVNGDVTRDRLRLWIDFTQAAPRWDKLAGWRIELTSRDAAWTHLTGEAWNPKQKKFSAQATLRAPESAPAPQQNADAVPAFVADEFRVVWEKCGGESGELGPSTSAITRQPDGRWLQVFERGRMYWDEKGGTDLQFGR